MPMTVGQETRAKRVEFVYLTHMLVFIPTKITFVLLKPKFGRLSLESQCSRDSDGYDGYDERKGCLFRRPATWEDMADQCPKTISEVSEQWV